MKSGRLSFVWEMCDRFGLLSASSAFACLFFACSSFRGYRWVDVCKELRILAPDPAEPVGGKQILVESKLRVVQVGNRRY